MDAYEAFWKIKTIWMQNCTKVSGVGSVPGNMSINVDGKKVIDIVYDEKTKTVEIITEDNNDQEKI